MTRILPRLTEEEMGSGTRSEEAGFGALRTERGSLPLKALAVQVRLDGLLARTIVEQTFVNTHAEPLEATYIFPLPDRAAVTQFHADRQVQSVGEDRAGVSLAVAVGVVEDQYLIIRLLAGDVHRIRGHRRNPEPALRVEGHRDWIFERGELDLGGEQVDGITLGELEGLQLLLGRRDVDPAAEVGLDLDEFA